MFKFKYFENNQVQKEISEKVTDFNNFYKYRDSLRSFQKNTNTFLTHLVEKQGILEAPLKDEDLSDSESEDEKCLKRNLSNDSIAHKKKC